MSARGLSIADHVQANQIGNYPQVGPQKQVIRDGNKKYTICAMPKHTYTHLNTSDYPLWIKTASRCRTESYYQKHLFKQGKGEWWDEKGWRRERDFVNAIRLLMTSRILTGCGGSLKGICKFHPKCNRRWWDVFCARLCLCLCVRVTDSSFLRDWVKHDAHYCGCWVRG